MDYYTTEEVFLGTETKVKELMRTVLEGENKRAQDASTEDGSSNAGEAAPKVVQKRKLQTRISFTGGKSSTFLFCGSGGWEVRGDL
jgi:hypothetical protein